MRTERKEGQTESNIHHLNIHRYIFISEYFNQVLRGRYDCTLPSNTNTQKNHRYMAMIQTQSNHANVIKYFISYIYIYYLPIILKSLCAAYMTKNKNEQQEG